MTAGAADPFGTSRIRRAVLAAWADLPSRFVEDLNGERDYGAGAYRDRLLVELAQNAADAARHAGTGTLRLELNTRDDESPVLWSYNTGRSLTPDGVTALAGLRASRKGEGDVGRFGVGFTAVVTVTDAPELHGQDGSVGFSRARTEAEVAALPAVAAEAAAAGGAVPLLRLPYPVPPLALPEGFVTGVRLPLRPDAVAEVTARMRDLAARPDPLLLALPALRRLEVVVDGETTVATPDRYRTVVHDGVTWAVPHDAKRPAADGPGVLFAPTPTEEPVTLPALLVAPAPLEPGRRHLVRGEAAAATAERAGVGYAHLLEELAAADFDVEPWLPDGPGQGWFDNAVREAARRAVARRRLLPLAAAPDRRIAPGDAVTVAEAKDLTAAHWQVLAAVEPDLVRSGRLTRALRTREVGLDELVERLPADPAGWVSTVAPLLDLTASAPRREDLAVVSVPLAAGGTRRGARGVLLPEEEVPEALVTALAALGRSLPVAHPEVVAAGNDVRRGLERLGAESVDASNLLRQSVVREVVAEIHDRAQDADPSAADLAACRAVFDLAAAAWRRQPWGEGELAWLRELLLPDETGQWSPAWTLVQPSSVISRWLDPEQTVALDAAVHARLPAEAWRAIGVADRPLILRAAELDPDAPDEELDEIDAVDEWLTTSARQAAEAVGEPVRVADGARFVRDLDLLDPDGFVAWLAEPEAAPVRGVVTEPVRWVGPDGAVDLPGHAAWWLGRELGITGTARPGRAVGVLPPVPAALADLGDPLLAALGAVDGPADLPADEVVRLLDALTDPSPVVLLDLWAAAAGGRAEDPPDTVWAVTVAGVPVRRPADEVVVVDDPRWAQRTDLGGLVLAPPGRAEEVADALDLALATERAPGRVTSRGTPAELPAALCELFGPGPAWRRHDALTVDGEPVAWWIDDAGLLHAETGTGLAHAVAWATGRWDLRDAAVAAVTEAPDAGARLLASGFGAGRRTHEDGRPR